VGGVEDLPLRGREGNGVTFIEYLLRIGLCHAVLTDLRTILVIQVFITLFCGRGK
jgi:hypothetical protein